MQGISIKVTRDCPTKPYPNLKLGSKPVKTRHPSSTRLTQNNQFLATQNRPDTYHPHSQHRYGKRYPSWYPGYRTSQPLRHGIEGIYLKHKTGRNSRRFCILVYQASNFVPNYDGKRRHLFHTCLAGCSSQCGDSLCRWYRCRWCHVWRGLHQGNALSGIQRPCMQLLDAEKVQSSLVLQVPLKSYLSGIPGHIMKYQPPSTQ